MFTKKHYINILSAVFVLLTDLYYLSFVELRTNYYAAAILSVFTLAAIILFLDSVNYKVWGINDVLYSVLALLLLSGYNYYLYIMTQPILSVVNIYYLIVIFILIALPESTDIKEKILILALFAFSAVPFILFQFDNPDYSKGFLNVFAFYLTYKYVNPEKPDYRFILAGAVLGYFLFASAWGIFPLVIFLLFLFRQNLKNMVWFIALILIVVICTALVKPVLLIPFLSSIQSIHIVISVLLLMACIYSGWSASNFKEALFASGVVIFALDMIYNLGVVRGGASPNTRMMMYFTFDAVPYFLLAFEDSYIDDFKGKILSIL